jgi:diguanylate cyclase (GGDEF)-like protein
MSFQHLSYSLPLFAAAALAGYLASLSWKQDGVLGRGTFGRLMVAVLIWTTTAGIEKLLVGIPAKTLCSQIQYLGISSTRPFWLLTALRFTRTEGWFRPSTVWMLWIIPVITVLLAATNGLHHAVWSEVTLGTGELAGMGIYGHGPWFWVATAYSYLLFMAGVLLLWRSVLLLPQVFRRQSVILLVAAGLPGLANVAYLTHLTPLPGLDLTPFAFSVSGLGLAWSVLRLRMLDLRPVARDTLVEHLRDGVVVVDPEGRVVDVNPAARHLLPKRGTEWVGQSLGSVFPALTACLRDESPGVQVREVQTGEVPLQVLEVTSIPLREGREWVGGRLLVLRDVTERRQLDTSRREANERLQAQLTEIRLLQAELQERVVRDGLTGLYNRRYLEELLGHLLSGGKATSGVAVVMVDIDSFKQLNDTYGHAAGDRVLQCLAEILRDGSALHEHACRYGGEEFAVVLTGATEAQAAMRAEAWRKAFRERADPSATLSAGVAVFTGDAGDSDALLRAADHALYAAKTSGRNRVCLAGDRESAGRS